VGHHKISETWEDDLALKIHAILDRKGVDWSSTDVVRIGYADEPTGKVVLWIGVRPDSLSYEVGIDVVLQCKRVLQDYAIDDVDVEIRQSAIIQSSGPQLLESTDDRDLTLEFREPFTSTLGMTICARSTPNIEGTAGFFLNKGGKSKGLLLATARHVVFPRSDNKLYERKFNSQPPHEVLLLCQESFHQHLDTIQKEIEGQDDIIGYQTSRMEHREGDIAAREDARNAIDSAKAKAKALTNFHHELSSQWAPDTGRILGHVIFSPPVVIGAGTKQYTQDVAVIDIDSSKIDSRNFGGNAIDLGTTKYSPTGKVLSRMMWPDPEERRKHPIPGDRLLRLRGTIKDAEMRNPSKYDKARDCIIVLKRGRTTGLTVGRANNIISYTRTYFSGTLTGVSKEWAIMPFDKNSGPFSAQGDSGAVVVDSKGRIGGILTAGGGITNATDITFVTPIEFVLTAIRSCKALSKAYPFSYPSA
jgi:hypothetical protein